MELYGTGAFDLALMKRGIVRCLLTGEIDATAWWDVVPECYRREVEAIATRTARDHFIGRIFSDDVPERFAESLHREIWKRLRPVLPQ